MRPTKLVMTGFESYKDKTVIDFEQLGTKGLYLITGDTGAGKTTIFDAITFALYGSPSGTDRSVEMLRSHFADENTPTIVELDFEANGNKYHITRNPDYQRKALKGDGITTQAASAELVYVTQSSIPPVSGVSKVNAEVEKILSLKKEQFCSIAMIAQGVFQKLLLSDKKQKEEIFRQLFHTEKFVRLEMTLKDERSSAKSEVENLKLKLNEALNRIVIMDADENSEQILKIKNSSYITENEIQILKAFVEEDERFLQSVLEKIGKNDNKISQLNLEINAAEEQEKLRAQISEKELFIKNLNSKKDSIFAQVEITKKAAEKITELTKEKNLLESSMDDYLKNDEAEKQILKITEEIVTDENSKTQLEKQNSGLETEIEQLKKELESLKNSGEEIIRLENKAKEYNGTLNELNEASENLETFGEDKQDLKDAQEKVQKASAEYEKSNTEYSENLRLYNLEQAGILAENLKPGCACPVCGSTEHPVLAHKSEKAPTQKQIEELKKSVESKNIIFNKLSSEAAAKKSALEKSEETINKLLKKYFESLTAADENITATVDEKISELKALQKKTEADIETENKKVARFKALEKEIPNKEKELSGNKEAISSFATKISSNKVLKESEEKALNERKSKLKYKTLQEAQTQFKLLETTIDSLTKNHDEAVNIKNEFEKNLEGENSSLNTLKAQLEKTEPADIKKLKEKLTALQLEKSNLDNQRDSLNERKGVNQESVNSVEALVPEIAKANEHYEMVAALCEVASGNSRGKKGLPSLETYVQMNCLDQINRRANLRLKKMTDNKYELLRRIEEDGSELGLDLNVKDFYTGRDRNVQTLSGGEQFQASLALALGLADEVQENSGGIKLDTMFIDEGFGTLDSETLNKAMHALEDLSQGNKLIGIISHVEELESRIDNKIVVTKNSSGISNAVIKKD